MPDAAKRELVELLARHAIPLIEDDIYGDLSLANRRPVVAKAYDREGLVLLCSSFSETIAPGYRIGWIAPGRSPRWSDSRRSQASPPPSPRNWPLPSFSPTGGTRPLGSLAKGLLRD